MFYHSYGEMQEELTARGYVKEHPLGDAVLWMTNAKDACETTFEILMSDREKWFSEPRVAWMKKCEELANK